MAAKVLSAEDEYIDMEITSHSNFFFCHSSLTSSPPNPREEFEFQMSSSSSSSSSSSIFQHMQKTCSSSPADLLFYKGKLLPLHFLQNSNSLEDKECAFEEYFHGGANNIEFESQSSDSKLTETDQDHQFFFYSTPLMMTTANSTPTSITPFESCNVSPSESCRFSRELIKLDDDDECDFEFDCTENDSDVKTKRMNNSSLGKKLRTWFGKASCKYEAYVTKVADEGSVSIKARESLNSKHVKVGKKNPFGQIRSRQYRSFLSSASSSSSSFSRHPNKSYGCQEVLQHPKGNSDIGNSILAAIAHCKQSQQCFNSENYKSV